MGPTYVIYSLRAQGFVYRNGTYGSQFTEARDFSFEEVVEYCKRARPKEGDSPLLPIDKEVHRAVNGGAL